jgi:putative peptide zinc metalloprotease protein
METPGFVQEVCETGTPVAPGGPALIRAVNPELTARRDQLLAKIEQLEIQRRKDRTREAAAAQVLAEKIAAVEEQLARHSQRLQALQPTAPLSGTWLAPEIDRIPGTYLERGDKIGVVADLEQLRIRAVAGQTAAARLIKEAEPMVEMRVKGRPEIARTGRVEAILPAGRDELPSAALGYAAGGATQIDLKDPSGKQAAEPFFEILVSPSPEAGAALRPGQRVVLRFVTPPKPLLVQGWRELLQRFQPRFNI